MFNIITKVKEDAGRLSNLNKRAFNKAFKKTLKAAVEKWHKEMLPDHFKRKAYSKYPQQYSKPKRRGKPLVETGSLRRYLQSRIDVSGTANRIKGRMRYGRPLNPSKKRIRAEIFTVMFSRQIDFKQAARIVGIENSYNPKSRELFRSRITAVSKTEIEILRKFVLDEMAKHQKPTRKIKTRIIK